MTNKNKRRHIRLQHNADIRILTPSGKEVIVKMHNFSESGLYLTCSDANFVKMGDIVEVNTLEFEDAPVQKTKVVRIEEGKGFAVEFIGV